jgi:hypothetical protein
MKTIWTALSVIAVANLLALAAFAGWLVKSDRFNMDRVRHMRVELAKTIAQEKTEDEAAKAKAEEDRKQLEAAKIAAKPPLTATERLSARVEATELDNQRAERLKREVQAMQQQLAIERKKLDDDKKSLDDDKEAFKQSIAETTAAASDAQFQKTLGVLEALKPAQAVTMIKEMLSDPAAPDPSFAPVAGGAAAVQPPAVSKNMGLVVRYLDAMDDKHRAKVITELAKGDSKLAADLLERIRKQGAFARVP